MMNRLNSLKIRLFLVNVARSIIAAVTLINLENHPLLFKIIGWVALIAWVVYGATDDLKAYWRVTGQ